jgi:hypothetical protein
VAHVNIIRQFKTDRGWKMASLDRDAKGRIKWSSGPVTYLIEWREQGRRCREAAGSTPSNALEAQRRKQFQLDAKRNNIELPSVSQEDQAQPLAAAIADFQATSLAAPRRRLQPLPWGSPCARAHPSPTYRRPKR